MSVQPVQQPIRPARVWYLVAGALMVGAVVWLVAGVVLGLGSFVRQVDRFQRVPIPGQGEVRFDEPGRYTVYYEGPAAGDETVAIPSFRLSVVPVGGGQELTVRPYEEASLYTSGNHSGRAVGTVQIDQPGKYLLRTEGEPQVIQAHVAVGEEIGSNLGLRAIPIVLLLLFGGQCWRWSSRSADSRHAGDRRRWPPEAKGRCRRAGWLIPAGAMSFATGTASGGPSTSPIAEPKGSTLCERLPAVRRSAGAYSPGRSEPQGDRP
jgi:hypothetical protein